MAVARTFLSGIPSSPMTTTRTRLSVLRFFVVFADGRSPDNPVRDSLVAYDDGTDRIVRATSLLHRIDDLLVIHEPPADRFPIGMNPASPLVGWDAGQLRIPPDVLDDTP